jgi:ornithine decarboxylase
VLRIRADDPSARVQLGLKYGADPGDAPKLLQAAKDLGLKVRKTL